MVAKSLGVIFVNVSAIAGLTYMAVGVDKTWMYIVAVITIFLLTWQASWNLRSL